MPEMLRFGWWRSPVAHLYGVQGVAGSNPVHPTKLDKAAEMLPCLFLLLSEMHSSIVEFLSVIFFVWQFIITEIKSDQVKLLGD